MNKTFVALAAAVTLAAALPSSAQANCGGCGVAAGVVGGLAAGAIIGSAIANSGPRYVEPAPVYAPPPPAYAEPPAMLTARSAIPNASRYGTATLTGCAASRCATDFARSSPPKRDQFLAKRFLRWVPACAGTTDLE